MSWKLNSWSSLALSAVLIGCDPPQNITPPPGSTGPARTEPGNAAPGTAMPVAPPLKTPAEDAAARPVPEGFTQTDSGLRYKILAEGEGPKPTIENQVTAKYRGWFDDGKEFDAGQIGPFHLKGGPGGVIGGWNEGIQLIGVGGKVELEVPPHLAYGPGGQGPIPPNAWLHFEVELLKVQ
jgi:FKBP-type peptidyl-prolyl cis-trans isomerase FkpA